MVDTPGATERDGSRFGSTGKSALRFDRAVCSNTTFRQEAVLMRITTSVLYVITLVSGTVTVALSQEQPKDATSATKAQNNKLLNELPFDDKRSFEDARRGLIARIPKDVI